MVFSELGGGQLSHVLTTVMANDAAFRDAALCWGTRGEWGKGGMEGGRGCESGLFCCYKVVNKKKPKIRKRHEKNQSMFCPKCPAIGQNLEGGVKICSVCSSRQDEWSFCSSVQ